MIILKRSLSSAVRLVTAGFAARGRLRLLNTLLHRESLVVRESLGPPVARGGLPSLFSGHRTSSSGVYRRELKHGELVKRCTQLGEDLRNGSPISRQIRG